MPVDHIIAPGVAELKTLALFPDGSHPGSRASRAKHCNLYQRDSSHPSTGGSRQLKLAHFVRSRRAVSAECSDKNRKVKGVCMKSLIHRSELQNMFTSNWQAIKLLCCYINQNKLFCFQLLSAQHSPLFIFATTSTNLPPMASLRLILRSLVDHSC